MADLSLLKTLLSQRFPERDPTRSERQFFDRRPEVAGYAAPDQRVVINPGFHGNRDSIVVNEGFRQLFRQRPDLVPSDLTILPSQNFGPEYANNPQATRESILARLLSGDPSGSPYTWQQEEASRRVMEYLKRDGPQD